MICPKWNCFHDEQKDSCPTCHLIFHLIKLLFSSRKKNAIARPIIYDNVSEKTHYIRTKLDAHLINHKILIFSIFWFYPNTLFNFCFKRKFSDTDSAMNVNGSWNKSNFISLYLMKDYEYDTDLNHIMIPRYPNIMSIQFHSVNKNLRPWPKQIHETRRKNHYHIFEKTYRAD